MKTITIFLLCAFASINALAQDIMYSRKQLTPLLINPGLTGLDVDLRASVHHRNQWSSVASPYRTSHVSFDTRLARNVRADESFLSLGVLFFNDRAGSANLTTNTAKLFLSGNIALSKKSRLSLGIMGGFGQKSIDFGNLTWGNQYDGNYNAAIQSNENFYMDRFSFFDVGSGIVWSFGEDERFMRGNDQFRAKVGYSISHLGLQRNTFIEAGDFLTDIKHVAFANAEIGISQTELAVVPELYFARQGPFMEMLVGSGFKYQLQEGSNYTGFIQEFSLTAGVYYRIQDAVIATFDIQYAHYTFGFGYDFTTSSLAAANRGRGAMEFHFKFQLPNPFSNSSRARI
jgi:type IX secretion system PorP/SprF family membrane protein